ncbi:hypothetical protein WKK05_32545 [Nostoc sp. UHCC 0302]|uniref:hypothetical protein n=1 Tax=Nostoc sp. UHCC 0302 TaxID=3134896 RepID=UPI00311CC46F
MDGRDLQSPVREILPHQPGCLCHPFLYSYQPKAYPQEITQDGVLYSQLDHYLLT